MSARLTSHGKREIGKALMDAANDVPDDEVMSIDIDQIRLPVYFDGERVSSITIKVVGGLIPLKVGERVEVEVVEIERRTVER